MDLCPVIITPGRYRQIYSLFSISYPFSHLAHAALCCKQRCCFPCHFTDKSSKGRDVKQFVPLKQIPSVSWCSHLGGLRGFPLSKLPRVLRSSHSIQEFTHLANFPPDKPKSLSNLIPNFYQALCIVLKQKTISHRYSSCNSDEIYLILSPAPVFSSFFSLIL